MLFRSYLPVAKDMIGHTWFVLLLTHPCYIVALQYITTLKGRLRQSERDAQASKERFLAMLSHEIRSPLQAMLGSIDLLGLKVQTPPERRAVDRLRQSAAQLDAHLRDVTEYTRLENPSWQLQIDTVDLGDLVRDVCDTYQQQAAAKGLRIYCEIPPDQDSSLQAVHTDANGLPIHGLLVGRPGWEVRELRHITGEVDFCEVFLDGARVPDFNRLGDVGDGWRVANATLSGERQMVAGAGSGERDPEQLEAARDAVVRLLAEVDLAASRFRPDSQLSRLNAAGGAWVAISPLLTLALRTAIEGALPGAQVDVAAGHQDVARIDE